METAIQVPTNAPHAAADSNQGLDTNVMNRMEDITGMTAAHEAAIRRFLVAIAFVYSAQIISSRTYARKTMIHWTIILQ